MADTALSGSLDLGAVFTDLVRVETRLYNAVADHVKAEAGISSGHFDFLRYVRDHPNARVADLAAAFAIGVGTTSKIVDRLEREGWLERHPNPANRRSSLLALTKAGASVVARTEPTWQAAIQDLIGAAITREELKTLALLLGALRSDLEKRQLGLPVG
jgi:MarR family transcriptional regulator, multiple antibiotic resistance protein MarR